MNLIEIRPPASFEEYHQACALVEEVYFEHGITSQRSVRHPKALFVAVRDGVVLGSVGFCSADQRTLPVEHYFGFTAAEACSFPRERVCEIVKLAAQKGADHTVFRGLIAACSQYAFVERSFGVGFAIVKPQLEKALNRFLRVPTHSVPREVVQARAAADYPRYFFEGLPPRPVAFHREDHESYLGRMLAELDGKATLDTHSFDHRHDYSVVRMSEQSAAVAVAA
jgi:hypothetical protein